LNHAVDAVKLAFLVSLLINVYAYFYYVTITKNIKNFYKRNNA